MDPNLNEWLNLTFRWLHLIAGIMWIGSSFFFVWMDTNLEPEEYTTGSKSMVEGRLWMVHSGGFYDVRKCKPGPDEMPAHLHWFKWEATFTVLTGLALLILIYYTTGGLYLVDPAVLKMNPIHASLLGFFSIVFSWYVYDLLWQSPVARKSARITTIISLALLCLLIYGLCHVFSGRGAFIHLGAIFGVIMVHNVWMRILPAQTEMIEATKRGEMPNFDLGKHAKQRSMHNSYMTLPVLFMMLSNHYASLYAAEYNWLVLIILVLVGALIRHYMIVKENKAAWIFAPVTACLLSLFFLTQPPSASTATYVPSRGQATLAQAQEIIAKRCLRCHSQNPSDETFHVAPAGITFDTPELMEAYADLIKTRAVVLKTMPLGNKTGMTADERVLLGKWLDTITPEQD